MADVVVLLFRLRPKILRFFTAPFSRAEARDGDKTSNGGRAVLKTIPIATDPDREVSLVTLVFRPVAQENLASKSRLNGFGCEH